MVRRVLKGPVGVFEYADEPQKQLLKYIHSGERELVGERQTPRAPKRVAVVRETTKESS